MGIKENLNNLFGKPKKITAEEIELQKQQLEEEKLRLAKLKELKRVEGEIAASKADLAEMDRKISIDNQKSESMRPRKPGFALFDSFRQ
jgi:hypothetical protein